MDIAGMLQQTGALDSIARQLGIDAGAAQAGAGALMPAIAGGFKKQAQAGSGGLGDLAGMLGGLGGGALLDEVTASGPTPSEPGNRILGQIFGSKDVSRTVASQAAQTSGVDPSILKKMLPLLAMAAAGYMTRQGGGAQQVEGGGLGGLVGQVLGGLGSGQGGASAAGIGGLASMLDLDGDGNPLDDILGMAGKTG